MTYPPRIEAERRALLRSIFDAPEDDLPRLIYADWLEEHGQPERAEYIRLGIEIESVANLYSLSDGPLLDLYERSKHLSYGKEQWFWPLYGPDYSEVQSEVRRGFIVKILSPFSAIENHGSNNIVEELLKEHPITEVRLMGWEARPFRVSMPNDLGVPNYWRMTSIGEHEPPMIKLLVDIVFESYDSEQACIDGTSKIILDHAKANMRARGELV